jgi:uncharacterized protein YjbI with pentapeptide repeats
VLPTLLVCHNRLAEARSIVDRGWFDDRSNADGSLRSRSFASANTRFEAGVHQVVGVEGAVEVGAVGGEGSGYSAIDEGGDAVDVLDVGIEGGVTANDAVEVSEFVEDGGDEVKWCWGLEEFCPGGYCCIFEVGVMTTEELLERYAAGERDFSGVEIDSARLNDAKLSGINLSGAILFGAELNRANLSGANLSRANLGSAWLEGANLRRANLSHAIISEGVLVESILVGADLSFADLTECPLSDADLTGAKLNGTILGIRPLLQGANLSNVDLSQSRIELPDGIEDHSVERAIFSNTILPDGTKIISFS